MIEAGVDSGHTTFRRTLLLICGLAAAGLFASRIVDIYFLDLSALRGWDNSFYYMWVRSLIIDQDIHFANEIAINNTLAPDYLKIAQDIPLTETGYIPNKYGIGWGLLSLPIFIIIDAVVVSLHWLGWESLSRDGYNPIYQIGLQCGHLGYAFMGLFFAWKTCRLFVDKHTATIAVCSTWGCSMLLYYQSLNLSMAHNLVFSLISVNYYCTLKLREHTSGPYKKLLALIFLTGGLLVVTRYQAAVYLLFPAIVLIQYLYRRKAQALSPLLLTLPLAVIPVALQLLAWKVIYGQYIVSTYAENGEHFTLKGAAWLEVLFSPNHGHFYWHPLMLLSVIGFIVWAIKRERVGLIWLISGAITYVVNATWWCWSLGSSFGLRNFEGTIFFSMCGMAYLISIAKEHPFYISLLKSVIILALLWNINLVILYATNVISRNSAVTFAQMLKATYHFYF